MGRSFRLAGIIIGLVAALVGASVQEHDSAFTRRGLVVGGTLEVKNVPATANPDSVLVTEVGSNVVKKTKSVSGLHGVTPGTLGKAKNLTQWENSHVSESGDTTIVKYAPPATPSSYNDTMYDEFDLTETPVGGWWRSCTGYGVTGVIIANSGYATCYADTGVSLCDARFQPDQMAEIETHGDGGMSEGVIVRGDALNLSTDGYYFVAAHSAVSPWRTSTSLYKIVGGVKTVLGSGTGWAGSGYHLYLKAVGDSLFAYEGFATANPSIKVKDASIPYGNPGMISNGRSHLWRGWNAARSTYVDTFTITSLSTQTFDHGCAAPNSDCYFFDSGFTSTVYIQSGGSGALSNLNQTSRAWTSSAAIPNGNVYASVKSDSIYKRIGGSGNFVRINAGYDISGMTYSTYDNKIYMTGNNKIFMADTGLSTITDLGATSAAYGSICAMKNGDLYVVKPGAGMVVRHSGATSFVPFMNSSLSWRKMWRDSSDNLYISKIYTSRDGYSIYRKLISQSTAEWYQRFPGGDMRSGFYRPNGAMYALGNGAIYTKGSEIPKIIFKVIGGDSKFEGHVSIENISITQTPAFIVAVNPAPDNTLYKTTPQGIVPDSAIFADSAGIAGRMRLIIDSLGVLWLLSDNEAGFTRIRNNLWVTNEFVLGYDNFLGDTTGLSVNFPSVVTCGFTLRGNSSNYVFKNAGDTGLLIDKNHNVIAKKGQLLSGMHFAVPCSLFNTYTYVTSVTAKMTLIDSVCRLDIPTITGTLTEGANTILRFSDNVPQPKLNGIYIPVLIDVSTGINPGLIYADNTPGFAVQTVNGGLLPAGTGGLRGCSISFQY